MIKKIANKRGFLPYALMENRYFLTVDTAHCIWEIPVNDNRLGGASLEQLLVIHALRNAIDTALSLGVEIFGGNAYKCNFDGDYRAIGKSLSNGIVLGATKNESGGDAVVFLGML